MPDCLNTLQLVNSSPRRSPVMRCSLPPKRRHTPEVVTARDGSARGPICRLPCHIPIATLVISAFSLLFRPSPSPRAPQAHCRTLFVAGWNRILAFGHQPARPNICRRVDRQRGTIVDAIKRGLSWETASTADIAACCNTSYVCRQAPGRRAGYMRVWVVGGDQ